MEISCSVVICTLRYWFCGWLYVIEHFSLASRWFRDYKAIQDIRACKYYLLSRFPFSKLLSLDFMGQEAMAPYSLPMCSAPLPTVFRPLHERTPCL